MLKSNASCFQQHTRSFLTGWFICIARQQLQHCITCTRLVFDICVLCIVCICQSVYKSPSPCLGSEERCSDPVAMVSAYLASRPVCWHFLHGAFSPLWGTPPPGVKVLTTKLENLWHVCDSKSPTYWQTLCADISYSPLPSELDLFTL